MHSLHFACEDITGVSASEVEIKSSLQFIMVRTVDVQETLIQKVPSIYK